MCTAGMRTCSIACALLVGGESVMRRGRRSADKRHKRGVLIPLIHATAVTAVFALICPVVVVAVLMVYARLIHKSVDIEWNILGMLGDPLGLLACGAVFLSVFAWRVRR